MSDLCPRFFFFLGISNCHLQQEVINDFWESQSHKQREREQTDVTTWTYAVSWCRRKVHQVRRPGTQHRPEWSEVKQQITAIITTNKCHSNSYCDKDRGPTCKLTSHDHKQMPIVDWCLQSWLTSTAETHICILHCYNKPQYSVSHEFPQTEYFHSCTHDQPISIKAALNSTTMQWVVCYTLHFLSHIKWFAPILHTPTTRLQAKQKLLPLL